jgi:hypothetical protein
MVTKRAGQFEYNRVGKSVQLHKGRIKIIIFKPNGSAIGLKRLRATGPERLLLAVFSALHSLR